MAMAMAMARWLALGAWLGALLLCGAWAQERPRLVGAPMEARMDADAQRALNFAVEQYNLASNDAFRSRVAEVVSLHRQIVTGVKYIFNIKLGRTSCRKSDTVVEDCAFLMESGQEKATTCIFEVVIVPWQNSIRMVKNKCQ